MAFFPLPRKLEEIAPAANPELIREELRSIVAGRKEAFITGSKDYEVYLLTADEAPFILKELGRLREITFRAIGEGTGKRRDLDTYDYYYRHLVLWDKNQGQIAGAYRMGFGPEIIREHGMRGFYLRSLFKVKKEGRYLFEEGLELGRAFISEDYQLRPLPLFLMWKAIVHIILTHPNLHYILGSVSISNRFSRTSKSLIVNYIKKFYFDAEYAEHIKAKKEFKPKLGSVANKVLSDTSPDDLKRIDKLIAQLEPDGVRFPVLLKKYLTQNARVVGFNVDPLFGHSLDGFMYINTKHLPQKTLEPVLEELELRAKESEAASE
mgnify:CR=1 FL=1